MNMKHDIDINVTRQWTILHDDCFLPGQLNKLQTSLVLPTSNLGVLPAGCHEWRWVMLMEYDYILHLKHKSGKTNQRWSLHSTIQGAANVLYSPQKIFLCLRTKSHGAEFRGSCGHLSKSAWSRSISALQKSAYRKSNQNDGKLNTCSTVVPCRFYFSGLPTSSVLSHFLRSKEHTKQPALCNTTGATQPHSLLVAKFTHYVASILTARFALGFTFSRTCCSVALLFERDPPPDSIVPGQTCGWTKLLASSLVKKHPWLGFTSYETMSKPSIFCSTRSSN